jgi:hypothetical protein
VLSLPPRVVSAPLFRLTGPARPRPARTKRHIAAPAAPPTAAAIVSATGLSPDSLAWQPVFAAKAIAFWSNSTNTPTSESDVQVWLVNVNVGINGCITPENGGIYLSSVQSNCGVAPTNLYVSGETYPSAYGVIAGWWTQFGGRTTSQAEIQALDKGITGHAGPIGNGEGCYAIEFAELLLASLAAFGTGGGGSAATPANTGPLVLSTTPATTTSPTASGGSVTVTRLPVAAQGQQFAQQSGILTGGGGTTAPPAPKTSSGGTSSIVLAPSPASGGSASVASSSAVEQQLANAVAAAAANPVTFTPSRPPPPTGRSRPAPPSLPANGGCPPGTYPQDMNCIPYSDTSTTQPIPTAVAASGLALAGAGAAWLLIRGLI